MVALGLDILGEATDNESGQSVSLSSDGSTVAIGARNDDNGQDAGHVRVFNFELDDPAMDSVIPLEYPDLAAAIDLSDDGKSLVIAHNGNSSLVTNEVWVFDYANGQWSRRGDTVRVEKFGQDAAISGDGNVIAVGDPFGANRYGKGWVWGWNGTAWEQRGNPFQGGTDSDLMQDAALNGDGSVVSFAEVQYAFNREGRVRAWDWAGGAWQESFNSVGPNQHRISAPALSADGQILAHGESRTDGGVAAVRVYTRNGDSWGRKGGDLSISPNATAIFADISADGSRVLLFTEVPSTEGPECVARTGDWNSTTSQWDLGDVMVYSDVPPRPNGAYNTCRGKISGDGTRLLLADFVSDGTGGQVQVMSESEGGWTLSHNFQGDADDVLGFDIAINHDGSIIAMVRRGFVQPVGLSDVNQPSQDSDGDGVLDSEDAFPTDPVGPSLDTDGDGSPDDWNPDATAEQIASSTLTLDDDDDNDGIPDIDDYFPTDPAKVGTPLSEALGGLVDPNLRACIEEIIDVVYPGAVYAEDIRGIGCSNTG